MNTKIIAVFLLCLVFWVYAAPFCGMCTNMIDDVKAEYNNDFSNVTADQLLVSMKAECKKNTQSSLENNMCVSIVTQDKDKLLAALKAGETSHQVCVEGNMC